MTGHKRQSSVDTPIIGLIPAGGQGKRIAPLPCSKELFPVGFRSVNKNGDLRPKVACHYLLEKMRLAGVTRAYMILRQGKWDIPAYLGDGQLVDMHLAYLMMRLPFGAPFTLDQAYPFVQDALVIFGFPDIIFQPEDAFIQLLARQAATKAEAVLGIFPADQPQTCDMVDVDNDARLRQVVIKPHQTHLDYTWMIAVWTPVFTHFMHEYLISIQQGPEKTLAQKELFVGDVINAAIDHDLQIETVLFPKGIYLDIGTPDTLIKAVDRTSKVFSDSF